MRIPSVLVIWACLDDIELRDGDKLILDSTRRVGSDAVNCSRGGSPAVLAASNPGRDDNWLCGNERTVNESPRRYATAGWPSRSRSVLAAMTVCPINYLRSPNHVREFESRGLDDG